MACARACIFAGFFFVLTFFFEGCALLLPQTDDLLTHRPTQLPDRIELSEVPFFPQEDYQCGPASLAMALQAAGADVTVEVLTSQVYLPARHGSLEVEMLAAARRHGMVAYQLAPELRDVLLEIANGTPVIALQNYGLSWFPIWHYAVVVGYDLPRAEFMLRSGLKPRLIMPFGVFEYLGKDGERWAMVAIPPQRLPATATEAGYARAAAALEKSGQTESARAAYATLLARWPDNLTGLIGAGNTAYTLGDLKGAEATFRRAAEVHPESAAAYNNLAQTLADQGKYDEAVAIVRRAISLGGARATFEATLQDILDKQQGKIEQKSE